MSQHKQVITVANKNAIGNKGPGQYAVKEGKRLRVLTVTGDENKVDQSQKDNTDLSKILEPSRKAELLRHTVKFEGEYDDIPAIEYQDALAIQAKADQMFEALPRHVKNKFENNPHKFLEFVNNPGNVEEMKTLGLMKGNDGLTESGTKSGAPTEQDQNGDGIPDSPPKAPA